MSLLGKDSRLHTSRHRHLNSDLLGIIAVNKSTHRYPYKSILPNIKSTHRYPYKSILPSHAAVSDTDPAAIQKTSFHLDFHGVGLNLIIKQDK
jgi:hypothetical protein